jgi:hypothetical protein
LRTYLDNLVAYTEEAYLYNLITTKGADRIDIQHAAWNITDPNYKINAAAQAFVQQARTNSAGMNLAGFQILSAKNGNEQEFLIWNPFCAAPEPSSFTMLGGLLLGIGLIKINRKKAIDSPQPSI